MRVIKFQGKIEKITAPEERCLRLMVSSDFAAAVSDFSSRRRGGWISTDLPQRADRLAKLGCQIMWKQDGGTANAAEKRTAKFFAARPRVQQAVIGTPRRINAILAQLGEE